MFYRDKLFNLRLQTSNGVDGHSMDSPIDYWVEKLKFLAKDRRKVVWEVLKDFAPN